MGAETNTYRPDELLEKTNALDGLFAEIGMPLPALDEAATRRHLVLVPVEDRQPKSHEQQAAEFFGKNLYPSPLKPAS